MRPTASAAPRSVFLVSVSSDIGEQLALEYLRQGAVVAGTYRTELPVSLQHRAGFSALRCDVSRPEAADQIREFCRTRGEPWDLFVSCVGQLAPVAPFFGSNFEDWASSMNTNSTAQLRALHAVHPFRRAGQVCHVVFFAGGGTNNAFPSYSAYCVGKMALIKMCELLDDENPDLNVFIVGTGWVRTKIHRQTLAAGERAGANLQRTQAFLESATAGTSHRDIAAFIQWGVEAGRSVAGGRNFSIVHDPWRDGGTPLAGALAGDKNKFKLRRHGNTPAT
jgi:NAD(P)-dependent dehydrogenase (short-subunit alcohol dehydrogenase family)